MTVAPAIPDHEMLQVIGEGSYGEVWLARNAVGTRRAVKVIRRERFDSARPFEREFIGLQKYEPLSRSHEGLVDVLQLGRNDAAGYFYYIMELADSAAADDASDASAYRPLTLRAAIDMAGRLSPEECVRHFIALAGALDHLHRHGLLHRDVKPSNIIFVGGAAKLADIGLVTEVSESRSYVGTEGYIPPEGPGLAAADIYALGKVLYEAFTGEDRMNYPSLPAALRTGGPESQSALEINAIALRACEPLPEKRYASARQFAGDLALLQSGRSIKGLRRIEGRLKTLRAATIAVAGITLAAVGTAWFSKRHARAESSRAAREHTLRERAERSEEKVRGAVFAQALALARAECLSPLMGRRFRALDALAAVAADHPGDAALRNAAIMALALPDARPVARRPAGSCVDPGMRRLATPDGAGVVRLYELGRTPEEDRLEGELAESTGCRTPGPFSLGGDRLAGRMQDGSFVVWETKDRTVLRRIPRETAVRSYDRCEFTHDGGALLLIQPQGLLVVPLEVGEPELIALPFAADTLCGNGGGKRFALSARSGNRVVVVDVPQRRIVHEIETPGVAFSCILSPDCAWLLACSTDARIHRFSLTEPETEPDVLALHDAVCVNSAFHPDSDVVLTGAWDGSTALGGMGDGARLARHPNAGLTFLWRPDGRCVAWQDAASRELVFAESAGRNVCRIISLPASSRSPFQFGCLTFMPDGKHLAVSGADGVRFFETERGSSSGHVPTGPTAYVALPSGEIMLASTNAGLVQQRIHGTSDSRIAATGDAQILHAGEDPLLTSNDRSTVALMTDRGIEVRRDNGAFQLVPGTADGSNRSFSLSSDGRRLALRAMACSVWDTETGQRLCTVPLGGTPCLVGTAPVLVGGHSKDHAIEGHDASTGALLWRTPLPEIFATQCTASPDGALVAAAGSDGSLLLVESATGRISAIFQQPEPRLILHVTFSPDGSKIAAATAAGTVLLWNLPQLRAELAPLGLDW